MMARSRWMFAAGICACFTTAALAQPPKPPQQLTLPQAEQLAIRNHPQLQAARNLATAANEQVAQQRSAYYPLAYGSATAVDAEKNSRIAAGGLNNPIIYDRYSNGFLVDQMITDFGRTRNLVKSANYRSQAANEDVQTTREQVLLGVDQAYFGVLKAEAVLKVAQETVKERQLVSDQVITLEQNKIKSGLDVSFANVNLAQAQLMLVQAQNGVQDSYAQLSEALGYPGEQTFDLSDVPVPPAPPANFDDLLQEALRERPELISQRFQADSAHSYATAERDLWFPTISAAGAAGVTPVGANQLATQYAAAGVNVNIPIFNGHLFGALRGEAQSRARAQDQDLRDLQDRVARDVRTAWLNANTSFQNLGLTDKLLNEANQALQLAQSRYRLGLSSIVELTQAQLNQTQAQIQQASAKYDYQIATDELNFQLGVLN